jgi:hypothetical protein
VLAAFEASRTNQPTLLPSQQQPARTPPAHESLARSVGVIASRYAANQPSLPPEKAPRWIRADGFIVIYFYLSMVWMRDANLVARVFVVFAQCGRGGCWQPPRLISISTG